MTRAGRFGLTRHPVLALGFRPFYLLAALFAAIALLMWIAFYVGVTPFGGYLQGVAWHSHEMVFGFASAVIAGFLLTAVRNWTGLPTPTGANLAGLAAVWALARVLALTGPANPAAFVDAAFLPLLGLALAIPIWRSKNTRNFKILAVLAGLTAANVVYHLAYLNRLPAGFMGLAITAALDTITILMAIVGGRVIPAFTANAITQAKPRHVWGVEVVALGSLVLVLAGGIVNTWYPLPSAAWIGLLVTAAFAHTIRLVLWEPYHRHRNALLWMLPVAYAWIPLTLALRAYAHAVATPSATAVHALTLGAMSGLMVAMMMRSALGHTGRALTAGSFEIAAFVLIQLAAIGRVLAGFMEPGFYQGSVIVSGMLWSLAFMIFAFRYWRILTEPRIDGSPG